MPVEFLPERNSADIHYQCIINIYFLPNQRQMSFIVEITFNVLLSVDQDNTNPAPIPLELREE